MAEMGTALENREREKGCHQGSMQRGMVSYSCAMHLRASRHHAVVLFRSDTGWVQGSEEAGPAGAAVVFLIRAMEFERDDRSDRVCSLT